MSLEEFQGYEQGDKMDAASFEKFKERMKAAAAQIQAIRKEEKKRKKKEDELVKILLKFIQYSHKKDLVLLISRTLEKNLPANFILAAVLLGNEDIQKEVGEYLMLPGIKEKIEAIANVQNSDTHTSGERDVNSQDANSPDSRQPDSSSQNSMALTLFGSDASLPLKVRIEVDQWISNMLYQASESPTKLLKTAFEYIEVEGAEDRSIFGEESEKSLKKIVCRQLVKLVAHIMFDFLEQNNIQEDILKLEEFSEFILKGILTKTREDIENRKELGGTT